ncbi:MAG: ATP-binding protein [Candidatus Limnocylindrales bacterium]
MTATGPPADVAALAARIETLERESRRAFEDAQREADALFAQYQLSQLMASRGSVAELASAVVVELARLARADGGALWVEPAERSGLLLVAAAGSASSDPSIPSRLDDPDAAGAWSATVDGVAGLVLSERDPATFLALWASPGRALEPDGLRIAQLARHELGVALAGARLREALDRERHDLTAIVDGATDLILQVDGDRRLLRLNATGERLLGISAGEATGRTCREVLGCDSPGGHPAEACPMAEVIQTGQPIAYRETVLRGADGQGIRVVGGYAPSGVAGPEDARPRATAILRDISAMRALEELREGFVATVTHELRTPLALIQGYTETLLLLDVDPGVQRHYLERVAEVTARLTTLVEQILDVAHLHADPLILERVPASFAALVARLRGDLAATGRDARLVVDVPDDLPPIEVDPGRVGQILDNLVGNALKYASDGTPVWISARADDRWLVATIDDEGLGIPAEDLGLVTEAFHRAWNVRESHVPGTGLGLYISRRLIEAHGGQLKIAARPEGLPGTRVRFTLPVLPGRRGSPRPHVRSDRPVPEFADGDAGPGEHVRA